MTNPDNVGGQYDRELIALMLEVYASTHEAPMWPLHRESSIREQVKLLRDADNAEAARVRTVCRAAPAGGDVECFVREMRTSKGSEFFVVVKRDGRELTPHMYTERWKAEYDVASWQHLLCGAPEPDLLAYGPSDVSAPAGSGEVEELIDDLIQAASGRYDSGVSRVERQRAETEVTTIRAALLRKLQQGAE